MTAKDRQIQVLRKRLSRQGSGSSQGVDFGVGQQNSIGMVDLDNMF